MYLAGIIGCGRIAGGFENLPGVVFPSTHAGAYQKNPNTKLICVADNNSIKLKKFVKNWKIENSYTDYKQMLLNIKLDLISVCTHDDSHFQIVVDIINAGTKNIFCEKPLAKNSAEIVEMLSYCRKKNVNLFVNHTRRWNDIYIYTKKFITQGSLGSIISLTGRYTSGLRVIGSHMIDIMRYLVGEIIFIKGIKENYQIHEPLVYSDNFDLNDPSYSAIMQFEDGIIGFLDGSSRKKYLVFEIEIQFENGKLILSKNGEKLKIWAYKNTKLTKIKIESLNIRPMMENAMEHIVDVMSSNSHNNICNGEDGLKVIELIETIEKEK